MEKKKTLEEIFWKKGKDIFVNNEGKEIKPLPIGLPILLIDLGYNGISKKHPIFEKENLEIEGKGINAYSKSIYMNIEPRGYSASVQFYKI